MLAKTIAIFITGGFFAIGLVYLYLGWRMRRKPNKVYPQGTVELDEYEEKSWHREYEYLN